MRLGELSILVEAAVAVALAFAAFALIQSFIAPQPDLIGSALNLFAKGFLSPITGFATTPVVSAVTALIAVAAIVGTTQTENPILRIFVLAVALLGWVSLGSIVNLAAG